MLRFLTQEWIEASTAALDASDEVTQASAGVDFTVQQIVTDAPEGEVRYWTRFADGTVSGDLGQTDDADVTFTLDYETAVALDRGELNAQAAFMQGRLNVSGNVPKLLQHQGALQTSADVLAALDTTY